MAQTLGYSPQRAYWRVVWPQLAPRLFWPLLAVLAYGLTVVDVALVIGPASPPTLAVLAWQWLQDADLTTNAQGAAAGGVLAIVVLVCVLVWRALQAMAMRGARQGNGERGALPALPQGEDKGAGRRHVLPPLPLGESRGEGPRAHPLPLAALLLAGLYAAILLTLAVGSIAGIWPFPALWPEALTGQAWHSVWSSRSTLATTLLLALSSAALALAWCVAWLELAPRHWDNTLRPLLHLPLVLPAVLWVVGMYSFALTLRIEGQWSGLLFAHTLMVLPYVLIALSPAYLGFDPRCATLSASLGHGRWRFLLSVKWPLLRRALASSAAVGFAVSVAQYLPTLYVGAGRFSSVTTEAVTLAAGAQRSLTSAYGWLQFLLPVLAFGVAAYLGRPRRFKVANT
ncbi:hypothetical protein ACVC7V_05585 [Hydrogenophaga sp. A37]